MNKLKKGRKINTEIKSVREISDEFLDNRNFSPQLLKDLAWHIENDYDPKEAIYLVADAHLLYLSPRVAKHLDHEDDFVRQVTIGCLISRLKRAEYAEKVLDMALNDPESGPRALATSNLGAVINNVDLALQKRIAAYLYDVMTNDSYDKIEKGFASRSILDAMNINTFEWNEGLYKERPNIVEEFRKKFGI